MKTRKPLYLGVAIITLAVVVAVAAIFVFPSRTFRLVSQDGTAAPGLGPSGKERGMAVGSWVSSDGFSVEEVVVGYWSAADARSAFELEQTRAERVVEVSDSSRMVAKFGMSFKVISLKRDQITYIQSPHLEAALAFERSWWKSSW